MRKKTKKVKKLALSKKRLGQAVMLAFVPHKKNGYCPHLIRNYGMSLVVFLVVIIQVVYNMTAVGSVLGLQSNISIASLLEQTNQVRQDNGLTELKLDERLNTASNLKVQDMIANQYWAHTSPDGVEPWKWLAEVDYDYAQAGENLAKGYYSTGAVMTAWMNSPGHRENIINPDYQDVGFAIVNGELNGVPTNLIVALYGEKSLDLVANVQSTFSSTKSTGNLGFFAKLAVALQSITPATIVSLAMIGLIIVVSAYAHTNRDKISKSINKNWKRNHGLYKALGMSVFGMMIIWAYSGGQI